MNFQRTQGAKKNNDFQIPEPWNGDMINAPILIISSNPSYSKDELYPTLAWPDPIIADFFINRFKDRGPKYSWVYNNKVLKIDGTREKPVRYWSSIKRRVEELLLRPAKPGIDFCITELVHCKSSQQIGVAKALPECTKRFLNERIGISGAQIIIGIGSFVRDYFKGKNSVNDIPIIYLPHPNAFEPKTVAKTHTEEEIDNIRKKLSNAKELGKKIEYSEIKLPTEKEVEKFIDEQITTHNNV
ncbi:MAG: hypothetical protein D6734_12950 [Candidatus Schekmanbacteria bacterium]|nr:MAG: hypothetical protein D6734_12950 [Candidatus Schekmanbacteria bacterium]